MNELKPVKLLAISCSPRRGNSEFLLDEALKSVDSLKFPVEVSRFSFRGKKFGPCISCLKCYTNGGKCIFNDDYEELRQLWINSDVVIYSCPVYVAGVPGQLKCFLDRLHNAFYGYYNGVRSMRHLKVIGAIAQGADLSGGQEITMQTIMHHAALINSMYLAPDGSYIGSGGWADQMGAGALKEKADNSTRDYEITITTAKSLVQRAVELAAIVKTGVDTLRDTFNEDEKYKPFIQRMDQ